MHKHDFRKGSGGFTSGFRYLIRNLWAHTREQDVPSPPTQPPSAHASTLNATEVTDHLVERISMSAADLLILQDGHVMRDVIEVAPDGRWTYMDGQSYNFLPAERREHAATVYFAWGNARNAHTALGEQAWVGEAGREDELRNILLHPVVEWRGKSVHFAEEIMNAWWTLNQRDEIEGVVNELLDAMKASAQAPPPCAPSAPSAPCDAAPVPSDPTHRLSPRWMVTPTWGEDNTRVNESAEAPYRKSNLIGYVDRGGGPRRRRRARRAGDDGDATTRGRSHKPRGLLFGRHG